jgi:hypothetical protein
VSPDGRSVTYTGNKRTPSNPDTLRYRIYDNDDDNAEALLRITVVGADLQPHAVDIIQPCTAGNCSVDIMSTPGIALGDNGAISVVGEDGSGNKSVAGGTIHRQGSKITFTANAGNVGRVDVQYQIVDDNNGNPPDQVSLAVVSFDYQNSAPTAQSEAVNWAANTPGDFAVHGADADGDGLTFFFDGADPGPTVTIDPNGTLHFGGAAPGVWNIQFHVMDPSGQTSSGTFTINVA